MKNYVLGLIFSEDKKSILLLKKNRGPEAVIGKLNGIGGKIEEFETAYHAMVRECKEETGLDIPVDEWEFSSILNGPNWNVFIFNVFTDKIFDFQQIEDEQLTIIHSDYIKDYEVVNNIPLLVAVALDDSGIMKPVKFIDNS